MTRTDVIKSLISILEKTDEIFDEVIQNDLKDSPLYNYFNNAYNNSIKANIANVKNEINDSIWTKLENAGLVGEEFLLKKEGFERAYKLWNDSNKKNIKYLSSLLRWLNTILGSLSICMPKLESIKEFKECIENAISDIIDWVNNKNTVMPTSHRDK